ncbi:hypothetical protein COX08_01555 [Candidatus Beckwithbacteria bacterium CG23_combo_of_CG06-09_8_20_14_all_34_8]|uniref:Fido domain-containing protein n=1 Tax=Candidatus Beckwithbacteria bacterium CG23_combo_of_CG06-09_8_20_14_all_34_8 TaxID=1974497 RepID=A0A2H0B6P0_9BACT|nr:MAG: hypothetical protein COX08_01555 [Candidatus Beckwithbacteria bacterium CG23_combo_of_CG06-09_8_20_14_all_34_8]
MPKPSEDSQTPESRWLLPEDFEYLCFDLARKLMTSKEPIPDYSTHDNALLESALGTPRQSYCSQLLYPTLIKQATILFYSIIKNHPFRNGNKRIAVMALLTFLALNQKWFNMTPILLYDLACFVSSSLPIKRDIILEETEDVIEKYLTDFPKSG